MLLRQLYPLGQLANHVFLRPRILSLVETLFNLYLVQSHQYFVSQRARLAPLVNLCRLHPQSPPKKGRALNRNRITLNLRLPHLMSSSPHQDRSEAEAVFVVEIEVDIAEGEVEDAIPLAPN